MPDAPDWRIDLCDALTSNEGANGELRRAIAYNLQIADEVASAGLDEHEERHRRRVKAHVLRASNLVALTLPVVIELWMMLPWAERARIAFLLVLPFRTGRARTSRGKR